MGMVVGGEADRRVDVAGERLGGEPAGAVPAGAIRASDASEPSQVKVNWQPPPARSGPW